MAKFMLLGVTGFTLLGLLFANKSVYHRNGICPWLLQTNSTCLKHNFLCDNWKCIERSKYCNGRDDCGDNSDEVYCPVYYDCPERMKKCNDYKCILKHWFCDGIPDCPRGEDELKCDGVDAGPTHREIVATAKAFRWLYRERRNRTGEMWGDSVDKKAVTLYSVDLNSAFTVASSRTREEMAHEISIQLLSRLLVKELQDIPSTDLASFVNAFLVTCLDPRAFHGMDIVGELRARVDRENYTNPYVMLSLCNAGDTITESDKRRLLETFWNKKRTLWTDVQAVVVMALACASKQPGSDGEDVETLRKLTLELKQHQYRNGSVESLQTTALVMQALLSAESHDDPDNFDEAKALEQILSSQQEDGSFGNLMNTYFVLPVLSCRSLVDISSDHCEITRRDEVSALENLANRSGPKIHIQYSLWMGNNKDLERNMALRVPSNISFYGVMEIAAEIDNRFSFGYVVKNRKPYINAIAGLQDDPERGRYWFLYKLEADNVPALSGESPAEVTPKENDHFVMWYKSGSWVTG